jgi:hypothetical protein
VLSENESDRIIVATTRCNVTVQRNNLDMRLYRPAGFSVVFRTPSDRNPVAGTDDDMGLMYAVCPWSGSRVRLDGFPDQLECPNCAYVGPVLWDEAC